MPWAALIGGSSSDPGAQYRDPEMRAACTDASDERCYRGKMRIATAAALLQLRRVPSRQRLLTCVVRKRA